jgi:hypothetical protein
MTSTYITTTIPYVNARPHLGFALELVQADVLARYRRSLGEQVRFQAGTDENSLKNVLAAEAAGVGVQEFVDASAAAFTGLAEPLSLSVDDLIRTSTDPRHRAGVERLWRACAARGDLYLKHYEGLYCIGCEQFYTPAELPDGRCPDHGTVPDLVAEENWFFRLSRYTGQLRALIGDGAVRVEPAVRRNEVLALIDSGLRDFSVSRSTRRARGWGIPVPGDPGQVIYVWFDALGNYLTALDYANDGENLHRWWTGASQRIHLLGKGVLRFHAVYWPAILLSAGEALPTDIAVHGYLTENGRKISKSSGATVDPYDLAARYGTDAVRWWLLREVPPGADADYTARRPRQRGTRQRLRQPGQPGRLPDPPLPQRPRPRRSSERTRRSRSRGGRRERSPPDRRCTGGLRLPPRHRGGLAGRGRGKPLRQPRPPVGPGQSRRPHGTGRRPVSTPARLPSGRHAAGPVPPGRLGPHHPPVHPGRDRAPPAPGPAPAQDHPASPCTRARVRRPVRHGRRTQEPASVITGSDSGCPRRHL